MQNDHFLCGGVFLLLIQESSEKNRNPEEHLSGLADEHSNPIILRDLVYVFSGSNASVSRSDASKFLTCAINGSVNVPFNDCAIVDSFDRRVHDDYEKLLFRMKEFIDQHVREEMYDWLVRALLDLIKKDDNIELNQEFYCSANGSPITKERMLHTHDYCLDTFLLGILHYILQYRGSSNTAGRKTLDSISEKVGNRYKYKGDLGAGIQERIAVNRYIPSTESLNTAAEISQDELHEQSDGPGSTSDSSEQNINNPFMFSFVQNGNNNTQIGHVDLYIKEAKKND